MSDPIRIPTQVTTDGDTIFTATQVKMPGHWSEHVIAWFDLSAVEAIAEWCNHSDTDLDDSERVTMHFDGETLIARDHGEDITVSPDSAGLYRLGDGWAWEIV